MALISGLFVSCFKENFDKDNIPEKTNLLTSGDWHFTDYKYYGGFPSSYTSYYDLAGCRKDDVQRFNRDGSGEINEGPTKCDSIAPQSKYVQWEFLNSHAASIEINQEEYWIDKLDAHEFKISRKHPDPYKPEISYGFTR